MSEGCVEYYDRGKAGIYCRHLQPAPVVLQDEFRLRVSRVRCELGKVEKALRDANPELTEAMRGVEELLAQNPNRSFKLCDPCELSLEIAYGEVTLAALMR